MSITIGQYEQLETRMVWSIYNRESSDAFDAKKFTSEKGYHSAFQDIELDMSAPVGLQDGIYTILHSNYRRSGGYQVGAADGARIENGLFVPESTDKACYIAVAKSLGMSEDEIEKSLTTQFAPFNYIFIEIFHYHKSLHAIEVRTGS